MVQLLGRPCIEYTIELLRRYGITEIALTVHYLPEMLKNHLGDGSKFGVHLHYFEENEALGTAGSVRNVGEFLDDRFLVISGDAMTDFDLSNVMDFHVAHEALATIVMTEVASPCDFGLVLTEADGKVLRFLEKPKPHEVFTNTVNTGIYVFEKEILNWIPKAGTYDFGKELFPNLLTKQLPLYGYAATGYWSDIGNLDQYRKTQFDMLNGRINLHIHGNQIAKDVWLGKDVQLHPNVKVQGPVFIGEGTVIHAGGQIGPYAVLGQNNYIEQGATITQSIAWNHVHIGESTDITGTMLCHRTKVESGITLLGGTIFADEKNARLERKGGIAGISDKVGSVEEFRMVSAISGEQISVMSVPNA